MNVAQMIDWLKTMPYNAEVQVVRHCSSGSYYEQGGAGEKHYVANGFGEISAILLYPEEFEKVEVLK